MPRPSRKPAAVEEPPKVIAPPAEAAPDPLQGLGPSEKLRHKYRLDEKVNIEDKGPEGQPLGIGPVMAPETFAKFDAVDHTQGKHYLDWMLFQAGGANGGGQARYELTLAQWGNDTTPEIPFREVYGRFKKDMPSAGDDIERFRQYTLSQTDLKVRDRVHAVWVFVKLFSTDPAKRKTEKEAEEMWERTREKRKREYVLGDQDHVRIGLYGFSRNWPGELNMYEKITTEMRLFLSNRRKAESWNANLEQYNAAIALKNQNLPPEQQFPEREHIDVNFDIGHVLVNRNGNFEYRGEYPKLESLAEANRKLFRLTVRERVQADVKYVGRSGNVGRNEKVYEDENLVVVVPLTVAASIRSGFREWCTSHPENIDQVLKNPNQVSNWTKHTSGSHGMQGHFNERIALAYFTFKENVAVPTWKTAKDSKVVDLRQVAMMVFAADLPNMEAPFPGILWWDKENVAGKATYQGIIQRIQQHYGQLGQPEQGTAVVKSFEAGAAAVGEMGRDFDPTMIISDFMKHHEKRAGGIRGIREEIAMDAGRLVTMLAESD